MFYTIKNCPLIQGIYKINFSNGKCYIGLSNNIKRRIKEHNYDKRQPVLYNAIKKYGRVNEFEVLEIISCQDRKILKEKEEFWIEIFGSNSKEKGYNLTPGGDSYMTFYNPNGLFSEADLENIYLDLLDDELTEKSIAATYNCCEATIQRINCGSSYFNPEWDYPIRKNRKKFPGSLNHNALFDQEIINNIYSDLKDTTLSIKELAEKYSCCVTTIRNINNGKSYKNNHMTYPVRKEKVKKKLKRYSEEDIDLMISLLQEKTLSMTEIGKMFNCSRDYIGEINSGLKYHRDNLDYPIRIRSKKQKNKEPVSTIHESVEQSCY